MTFSSVPVGICAGVVLTIAGGASGVTINTGVYQLHNHPDGNARPPYYGCKLDELYDVTPDHDIFTFDFDDVGHGSNMRLYYDGSSIHIYGAAWGGRDIGSTYANDQYLGLYSFDFTYTVGVHLAPGDDDLRVDLPDPPPYVYNYGTLIAPPSLGGITIQMRDGHYDDGTADFRFGDDDSDAGWRGYNGISGWGWLFKKRPDQSSFLPQIPDSDWLFTATYFAPAPGGGALAIGALGFAGLRPRRRSA